MMIRTNPPLLARSPFNHLPPSWENAPALDT